MAIFREHDFLTPEEVTVDKIFEICQNAYLNSKLPDDKGAVIIEENNVLTYVQKEKDSLKLVYWTNFGVIESDKQDEALKISSKICNDMNNRWRMISTYAGILDDGRLFVGISYEIFYDRGLFIPQLVSNIKRFSNILNSLVGDDGGIYLLAKELEK